MSRMNSRKAKRSIQIFRHKIATRNVKRFIIFYFINQINSKESVTQSICSHIYVVDCVVVLRKGQRTGNHIFFLQKIYLWIDNTGVEIIYHIRLPFTWIYKINFNSFKGHYNVYDELYYFEIIHLYKPTTHIKCTI